MKLTLINEILELKLQYHSTLNPQVWQPDNQLKPVIRNQLLKIANYWRDFAAIPEEAVVDIVFTGSLANYNYTPMSDFDLHLVVDMSKMPIKDEELRTKNIFHMKALWAKTHPDIKIYGYPVELFAEDVNTRHPLTQGVYSLKADEWVHMPARENINYDNDANLRSKVDHFQRIIDDLIDNDRSLERIKSFKEKLRNMRGDSIQKHGELRGMNNLVFKELRNRGYLDKLSQHETKKFDNEMSINEEHDLDESLKAFITEHKLLLSDDPNALETHIKYHEAGIPLPDRNDLYRAYKGGSVRYPKDNGGYVEHHLGGGTISHFDAKEVLHNEEGPARSYLSGAVPSHIWSLDGRTIGETRTYMYNQEPYHEYFMHKQKSDPIGGHVIHEANTLAEFNQHLAKYGLPPHKED